MKHKWNAVEQLMGKSNTTEAGQKWNSLTFNERVDIVRKATSNPFILDFWAQCDFQGLPGALQKRFSEHL